MSDGEVGRGQQGAVDGSVQLLGVGHLRASALGLIPSVTAGEGLGVDLL